MPGPAPTRGAGPWASLLGDEHAPLLSVGQVAGLLGVQPAFVRRLDTEGVVRPQRSPGGQRRYSLHELDRVRAVAAMADEGMTLPGIRRILVLEQEVAALHAELAHLRARLGGRAEAEVAGA